MKQRLGAGLFVLFVSGLACGSTVDSTEHAGATTGAGGATSSQAESSSTSSASSAAPSSASVSSSSGQGGSAGSSASSGSGGAGPGAHVTVFVTNLDGTPAPGIATVVNDAVGAVVSQTVTGADGKVPVFVPAGGLVAVYPDPGPMGTQHEMQAVVDPPDGSTITLSSYDLLPPEPVNTTFQITLTGYPANTATLALYDCYDQKTIAADVTGTTVTSMKDFGCGLPKNTIAAIALNAAMQPISSGIAKDIAPSPGNTVPVALSVDQDFFQVVSETIAPIPATANNAGVGISPADPTYSFGLSGEAMAPQGMASWTFTAPLFAMQTWNVLEFVNWQDGSFYHSSQRYRYSIPLAPISTFDPTALAAVNLNPIDVSNKAHPTFSWAAGPGPQGDVISVIFNGDGALYQIWMPSGSASSLRLPDIPPSLTKYKPASTLMWHGGVDFFDYDGVNDWADFALFSGGLFQAIQGVTDSGGSLPQ